MGKASFIEKGTRFGQLVTTGNMVYVEEKRGRDKLYELECDCKRIHWSRSSNLLRGNCNKCTVCHKTYYARNRTTSYEQDPNDSNVIIGTLPSGIQFRFNSRHLSRVSQHSWFCSTTNHIMTKNKKIGSLHLGRLILGIENESWKIRQADHIDTNPLNNLDSNLRLSTFSQNGQNRGKNKTTTSSRYKGVTWDKSKNKWMAKISIDKQTTFLGYYDSEDDAAKAYNIAALNKFGEFARINDTNTGTTKSILTLLN